MSDDSPAPGLRAILLDIEGTTTPIAFVTSVLFPYARERLHPYLATHAAQSAALVTRLHDEHASDLRRAEAVPPWVDAPDAARLASAAAYAAWLMDRDRKSTPLKELQGLIWEDGYRGGALVGEVFPDVLPAIRRWHAQGIGAGVYSSGSVLAQRLLFEHSSAGDLTPFLRWHFDTAVGPKTDPGSFRRIAAEIGQPAEAILFLSDVPRELDAACAAGLQVRLVVRPGNAAVPADHGYEAIARFDEIVA